MRLSRAFASSCRLAVVAALTLGASGCGLTHLHDLNFRVDDRLHFTSPADRSSVHQPFMVSWTIHAFTVVAPDSAAPSRDAGYFAVFVDRPPIKPDQTLNAVGHGDPTCEQDPSCPDTSYLRDHRAKLCRNSIGARGRRTRTDRRTAAPGHASGAEEPEAWLWIGPRTGARRARRGHAAAR